MPPVPETEGEPLGGEDLVKLVQLVRRALWGEGDRPEIRVEGVDASGLMSISIVSPEVVYRIKAPDLSALVALAGPRQQPPRALTPEKLPYVPRTAPAVPTKDVTVGIGPSSVVLAGGDAQEVNAIHAVKGAHFRAAVHTTRGPTVERQNMEYKPFNEDAVVMRHRAEGGAEAPEILAVGAFDQAGGEGAVEGAHGAASDAAARSFDEAVARIEAGADPEQTLIEAALQAGERVRALGVGAMTTFAAAVLIARRRTDAIHLEAHIATVGDTRILLVDVNGNVKERTRLHNLGASITAGTVTDVPREMALQFAGVLTRGVGGDDDAPDVCKWSLAPGDRLVVATDGLGDARELEQMPPGVWHADQCAEDQARVVSKASSPAEAVRSLVGYALDQMADHYGKPDNIAVAVAEAPGPRPD
jgi:serine/threonine protein phosphatase PrpC